MRALKIAAMILTIFPGSCVAHYAYWDYQWRRSERKANAFCDSVALGSEASEVIPRAMKADRLVRDGTRDGTTSYAVTFPGPVFNAFRCDLTVADGKVTSKVLVEPKD
jgi:hypothetical protein